MQILLVGGAVRNVLLGLPAADKDFLVLNADEEEFLRKFPKAKQVGKSFPVFLVNGLEFSFPRRSDPAWTTMQTLQADLEERDLTINAMALDQDGELYCHPQALNDLHSRTLRPAGPEAMAADPLRIFRAARFYAQYPMFRPAPELLSAMQTCSRLSAFQTLAPLRVGREVLKALQAPRPSNFFQLLHQTHSLEHWLQELQDLADVPAGPAQYHAAPNALAHTLRVVDACSSNPSAEGGSNTPGLVGWMALCHDLGKGRTPKKNWPRHINHERAGVEPARALARRLALSNTFLVAGARSAELHMLAGRYPELRPGTRVDLLMRLHAAKLVAPLFEVVRADRGEAHTQQALSDLKTILEVHLPPCDQGLGAQSGKRLRTLRAQALATALSR